MNWFRNLPSLRQRIRFEVTSHIQDWLMRHHYEIIRYPLAQYLRDYKITWVIDVGASDGGYGMKLRNLGYRGKITSFEPLPEAWKMLCLRTQRDPLWEARNVALGDFTGEALLHVAKNGVSSSFLEIEPRHIVVSPGVQFKENQVVQMMRLQDVFPDGFHPSENVLLKIDAQGYELAFYEEQAHYLQAFPASNVSCLWYCFTKEGH